MMYYTIIRLNGWFRVAEVHEDFETETIALDPTMFRARNEAFKFANRVAGDCCDVRESDID